MLACIDPVSLIVALLVEYILPVFWFLLNIFCLIIPIILYRRRRQARRDERLFALADTLRINGR